MIRADIYKKVSYMNMRLLSWYTVYTVQHAVQLNIKLVLHNILYIAANSLQPCMCKFHSASRVPAVFAVVVLATGAAGRADAGGAGIACACAGGDVDAGNGDNGRSSHSSGSGTR